MKNKNRQTLNWLDNYNDSKVTIPEGFVGDGLFNGPKFENPAWGGQFQTGGSIPGSVGFTYARTASSAPSEGKYAKKTLPSAQNGQEMKFYQEGLDWKPKSMQDGGGIIKDDRGQWDHPGEVTEIDSNEITIQGVPYDVLAVSNTGDTKLMKPGKNYKFKGKKVTEYPVGKNGINQLDAQPKKKLDDLLNFTNYNKPASSGWLDKFN